MTISHKGNISAHHFAAAPPIRGEYRKTTGLTSHKANPDTGAIETYNNAHWNTLFADYADYRYVTGDDGLWVNASDEMETASNFKAVDPTNIYGWLCAFEDYGAVRGTYLTMDADSVWNVTAKSTLNSLTLEKGAVISGTVTVDGETVDVSAGGSWTGEIVVTPQELVYTVVEIGGEAYVPLDEIIKAF